ncbi:NUDIX hydrolase [Ectobacillus polymachus]|uniref:NUDIX hydrolase n=1 Tax=Ectobacillus polymachus TaxID=1508806 RepID=UPI003A8715F8
MVVAGVFIFDEQNRILLQKRSDNGLWGHPGGYMELDETIEETARRETWEETGLTLGKLELLGVYSGPNFERTLQNGDEVSLVKFMFTCHEFSGTLHENNDETLQLRFFGLDELPEVWHLQMPAFEDLLKHGAPFIR